MVASDPLSEKLFSGCCFYLDTNVIIPALEETELFHTSFKGLQKACGRLRADLRVCQISLDELRNLTVSKRGVLKQVGQEIPDATAPKSGISF